MTLNDSLRQPSPKKVVPTIATGDSSPPLYGLSQKEHRKIYQREYQRKLTQRLPLHARVKNKKYRTKYPGRAGEQSKAYRAQCRLLVIQHYSDGAMKCACCGEGHYEFLGIDHTWGHFLLANKPL